VRIERERRIERKKEKKESNRKLKIGRESHMVKINRQTSLEGGENVE